MEAQARRIHPLVAGASVAVIVAAGVALAAITGHLPGSKAEVAPGQAVSKPAKPLAHAAKCHDCGVIVEVKEVEVRGKGTGVGAVAGGVGGAVLGHEIGGSSAGTAVGAVVGAVAGHQIEREARAHKRYDITVRMEDGSTRALSDESGTPLALKAGDKVHVSKEGAIRPI